MKLPLESITVGERRREDYGDLAGLAASMEKYGQLHPIVVDENGVLVAGGRRLRAAQSLGWDTIDCHDIGEVSEAWREEIELAENGDRKDLTPFERAKSSVMEAKRAARAISSKLEEKARVSSPSEETRNRGGRPRVYEAPKADVAQALGVSVGKLVKDEQHVAAAEKYPELQASNLTQRAAIEIAKTLDVLPEDQREERRAVIRTEGPTALLRAPGKACPSGELTPEQRAFYDFGEGLTKLTKWKELDPYAVADAPPTEAVYPTLVTCGRVLDWLNDVQAALKARHEKPALRAVR